MRVMRRLVGLVRPLMGFMVLAILMGLLGHACAAAITVLGGYGVLAGLANGAAAPLAGLIVAMAVCAVARGLLRYGEQACNHFIAFKLLALVRDRVFRALRRLAPAKLEGRDRGDLISHRLANVVGADEIFVLDGGRVVERGRHDELVTAGGRYATLWRAQRELEEYGETKRMVA